MQLNVEGLLIGAVTFIIIGAFHPIVIKAEYYFGTRLWWLFLLLGLAACAGALLTASSFWSAVLSVFAFSSFWGIGELFEQKKRVEKGWFPKNPKRTASKQEKQ